MFNKIVTLIIAGALSFSVNASQQSDKYLNLIDNPELLEKYWQTSDIEVLLPKRTKRARQSGCVDVVIAIDAQGKVAKAAVVNAYPEGLYNELAMQAVEQMQLTPSTNNGVNQAVATRLTLNFELDNATNKRSMKAYCNA